MARKMKTMDGNNKAALYARYISDNQRSESIDAQLRAMQNYCQQNYIVFNIIPDPWL